MVSLTGVTVQSSNAVNGAGGGIFNAGTLTLNGSTVISDSAGANGGGIDNSGTLTLNGSTVTSDSAAQAGGGIYSSSAATATNSTISDNQAGSLVGGGIDVASGTLTLAYSTIAVNTGGGIANGGTATLSGTIVSQTVEAPSNPSTGNDCAGTPVQDSGYNIANDASCSFSTTGSLNSTNPLLAPLTRLPGFPQAYPLCTAAGQPGADCTGASPAIDAGNPSSSLGTCPSTDEVGTSRPQGSACNIGAFETIAAAGAGGGPSFSFSCSAINAVVPSTVGVGSALCTVTPQNGLSGTISLVCASPGPASVCAFGPSNAVSAAIRMDELVVVSAATPQSVVVYLAGDGGAGSGPLNLTATPSEPSVAAQYASVSITFSPGSGPTNYSFTVNDTTDVDDGAHEQNCLTGAANCTLRAAIGVANGEASADFTGTNTINVSPNTYTLAASNGPLAVSSISSTVNVTGTAGAAQTIVDGGATGSPLTGGTQVFNITSGTVEITGLTVQHGNAANGGGFGVASGSTVSLTGVTVQSSSAGNNDGGGIFNAGALTLTGTTVSNNSALNGGGIENQGTVNLYSSTVSGNTTPGEGGGIFNSGTANLYNSTISDNTEPNAEVTNDGTLTAIYSTFAYNPSGAYEILSELGSVSLRG